MIEFPIDKTNIPKSFLDKFKPSNNPDFVEDVFDKQIRDDIQQFDPNYRIKINRDITGEFNTWLSDKRRIKKNISLNVMGTTRSGKSLIGLKMSDNNSRFYKKPFNVEFIVCGNQREFRQKLLKAKFGDTFQIDENAFSNTGEGSNAETQQLKDIQNIIAKQNIHTIYITPRQFLQTGANMGLEFHSTAVNDWLSKFMVFSLKANPLLMGYIIVDVGKLFNDYGCFFNRWFGGCTNPEKRILVDIEINELVFENRQDENKYFIEKLSIDYLKYSECVSKEFRQSLDLSKTCLNKDDLNKSPCPFYRICDSPMCGYEHKKDKWIDKEMRGGLNERTGERYRIVLEMIKRAGLYDEDLDAFRLDVKNAKEIKPLVDLYLPEITSTKLTITENKEIITSIMAMSNKAIFLKMIETLDLNLDEELKQIKNAENLKI